MNRYRIFTRCAVSFETKLVWGICLLAIVLFSTRLWVQIGITIPLLALVLTRRKQRLPLRKIALFVLPLTLVVFVVHLFYHRGTPLFAVWFLRATEEGLRLAILNAIRFVNFVFFVLASSAENMGNQLATRLAWWLNVLRLRRLADLAVVFFLALRFGPAMARELAIVKLAMDARGANSAGRKIDRLKGNLKLLVPLFLRVTHQTEEVAVSLALKSRRGTFIAGTPPTVTLFDMFLILTSICLVVMILHL